LATAGFKGHKVWAVLAYGRFPLDMHINLQLAK
jgi:hypothetical protein